MVYPRGGRFSHGVRDADDLLMDTQYFIDLTKFTHSLGEDFYACSVMASKARIIPSLEKMPLFTATACPESYPDGLPVSNSFW